MQSNFGPKQIIIAFLVVLGCYLGIYHWIEHRRTAKGPWHAQFQVEKDGTPVVTIRQPALGIEAFNLRFPGETLANSTGLPANISFDLPGRSAPFGEIIYEDLTFLPGVITFNLFGHEIEFLPRTLIINKKEVSWTPNGSVEMDPASKPEIPPLPPEGGTRDASP